MRYRSCYQTIIETIIPFQSLSECNALLLFFAVDKAPYESMVEGDKDSASPVGDVNQPDELSDRYYMYMS